MCVSVLLKKESLPSAGSAGTSLPCSCCLINDAALLIISRLPLVLLHEFFVSVTLHTRYPRHTQRDGVILHDVNVARKVTVETNKRYGK